MNPYLSVSATMAPQPHHFGPTSPTGAQQATSPPQQQSVPSQLSFLQRQQLIQQQQQQEQIRLEQFQQEHHRQQLASSMINARSQQQNPSIDNVMFNNNSDNMQQQQQQQQSYNNYPAKQNWDILTGPNTIDNPLALQIGPDGTLMAPRWDAYDLSNLPPVQIAPRAKNINVLPRPVDYNAQQHSLMLQRPTYVQPQSQGQQQQDLSLGNQQTAQTSHQQQRSQQDLLSANSQYLFNTSSTVPTISASDMGIISPQHQHQPHMSSSPVTAPFLQTSCSPEMPIKASPVEHQLTWASWEDASSQQGDNYATPAHTHTSFEEGGARDDVEFAGTKHLKVFTSSKKDDDGEFRKGQQFYLNIHLNQEDRERYRFLRIPTENIVLPCRADATGRISLNGSGKRSAESMSMPTSAQEEDVLSLKLTTYLEPEHRVVVPCGRCKDKTPEILRFHPGVNGKPMIDENGMVTLRDGQIKLIASAWCASTSHHRGPGTKFSFQVELTSMAQYHAEPLLVYEGRSDEVEIYASHGRDKGTRLANKNLEKTSKSITPPFHDRGNTGPPSPAKTASSSPPSSPSTATSQYESGPVKKRREDPPMTPPMVDSDMPPTIKSLEPRKGPICRENHVIIIGSNFSRGMTPMFGREYGTVVDINPFYIECMTPRYPNTETVRIWIYHNETYLPTDKTYEFTDEQAQSDMEQLLRNLIQSDGEGGDAGSYLSLLERIAGLPPSTDISGQTQSNGSTMLHNSVLLGYQAGVNMLIEEGIELDIEDDSGLTALDYAIYANNVEITETLLQAGSMLSYERLKTLNLTPPTEMSTLLRILCGVELPEYSTQDPSESSRNGLVEVYDEASEGALIPDTILEEDESETISPPPLTSAASTSSQGAVSAPRSMPQRGPRPQSIATIATQSTGMMSLTPTMSTMALSATSSTQSRPTVVARSANMVAKGGFENIWQCAKKGTLSLVKRHLQKDPSLISTPWHFDGRMVLSSACASNQPHELVEYLVKQGAPVNSADTYHKRTALHTLCEEGGVPQDDWQIVTPQADQDANEQDVLETMRFLLDNGAAVDAKNHWKETPLMRLFVARDCPLMVQELYSRGADSRLKSSKDTYPHGTAICYAAYYGRIKSLKWIIENDLLLNDEASIKDAIRWASKGESSNSSSHAPMAPSMIKKKEESKAEAVRLLEGWSGENGAAKRKALAKEMTTLDGDDWWHRMSGIIVDTTHDKPTVSESDSSASKANASTKMPTEMIPLWREVQNLSEGLSQNTDATSSSGSRMKWNPLTILRK
ncbi:hypothetical protein BG011_004267 [Mortierella polycephala]|uniref:IPT/TIG domain-containing protein n=1 Tax=Mortierella polycephala TaxID=41804 RepID=A0A9P6U9N9_9FUNG|nr:hypothetical protein BG011_004267 [Mortierella polycephala]